MHGAAGACRRHPDTTAKIQRMADRTGCTGRTQRTDTPTRHRRLNNPALTEFVIVVKLVDPRDDDICHPRRPVIGNLFEHV